VYSAVQVKKDRAPLEHDKAFRTIQSFIDSINRHSVEGLCALISEDHVFIDALGGVARGKETLRRGWTGYFRMFPDYQIIQEKTTQSGNVIGIFGTARGTYAPDGILKSENRWEIPAAWEGVVSAGLVSEWRIYGNIETVLKIMERTKGKD
jgi:ketosteroid isomerase-like protein